VADTYRNEKAQTSPPGRIPAVTDIQGHDLFGYNRYSHTTRRRASLDPLRFVGVNSRVRIHLRDHVIDHK